MKQAFLFILLAALHCQSVNAGVKDFVNVGRFGSGDLGTWSIGDGDQVWTDLNCVASSNYNNAYNDPPPVLSPPAVHMNYDIQVIDRGTPLGYYFYLDADDTNTGNARLAASFKHRDVKRGTAFEALADATYSSLAHLGQFKRCNNGNNSELQMTLLTSELQNARAGLYSGNFRVRARGGSSGLATHTRNLAMQIAVSQIVRVSALDNINLGSWSSGDGDLSAPETFCVYSNNATAAYNITFSSPQQDGGGNFRLANTGLTEYVPYSLTFADSVGGAGTGVGTTAIPGSGNNSASDCGGSDNAEIAVSVLGVDLGAATSDNYSDTITLLVAPL